MGCSSAIKGAAWGAIRIVLEMDKFENCLDRLESSKAFLGTAGVFSSIVGRMGNLLAPVAGIVTIDPVTGKAESKIIKCSNYDLPTKGQYEEHLTRYNQMLQKYGDIIDRDISTIKASARRIMTADTKG